MDVVIAKDDARAVAQRVYLVQHTEVVGTSIDEVATEPDVGVSRNLCEQSSERLGAALDVADDVKVGIDRILTGWRTGVEVHGCLWR